MARFEPDLTDEFSDARLPILSGTIGKLEGELDIFVGGKGGEQMEELENGSDGFPAEMGKGRSVEGVDPLAVARAALTA